MRTSPHSVNYTGPLSRRRRHNNKSLARKIQYRALLLVFPFTLGSKSRQLLRERELTHRRIRIYYIMPDTLNGHMHYPQREAFRICLMGKTLRFLRFTNCTLSMIVEKKFFNVICIYIPKEEKKPQKWYFFTLTALARHPTSASLFSNVTRVSGLRK